MELNAVDHLLAYLHVIDRDQSDVESVSQKMEEAGFSEAAIATAWIKARRFGYTRTTGLGVDELTPIGLRRGTEVAKRLGV